MGSQLFLLPSNFADFDCCCFLCYCLQRADTSTNCSNPPALSTFEPYLCIRRHLTRMLLARIRLLSSCISYLHTQTNKRKKQTNSYLSRLSQQYHRRRSRGGRGSPKQKFGGTRGIGDTRAQIFCSQTTEELPKKHHKAGTPEQKSITDTLRRLLVPKKKAFWIF